METCDIPCGGVVKAYVDMGLDLGMELSGVGVDPKSTMNNSNRLFYQLPFPYSKTLDKALFQTDPHLSQETTGTSITSLHQCKPRPHLQINRKPDMQARDSVKPILKSVVVGGFRNGPQQSHPGICGL